MSDQGQVSLSGEWRLQHICLVPGSDATVSSPGFPVENWHRAHVPTTVLNALVHEGVYPDPRYGLNNFRIPDASDEFNAEHDLAKFSHLPDRRNPWKESWWFRREFDAPADCGQRQRLVFDAINYRAEVWLNGRKITDKTTMVGGFRRFTLDVTHAIKLGQTNVLAVRVYPPDHVSIPQAQLVPFQAPRAHVQGIANDIMKDVTINVAASGYDCAPTVRDRLTGLWQEVRLEWGGPVRILDPFVRTRLPSPTLDSAALTVVAELVNDSKEPVQGRFRAQSADFAVEKELTVPAGQTMMVELTPDEFPQLTIRNPRLWWPLGHGPQNLHELQTEFVTTDGACSCRRNTRFGIREVTKVLHKADGEPGLRVTVNGRRIFCRGGYLQADTLLDQDMLGEKRLGAEFRYLAAAGMNTISYEDLPNPPEVLLDLCDQLGIMIWHCFFQCHWLTVDHHPLDHDLLEASAADITRRCRAHPSIVVYMCMNEGATRESQYRRWRRQVQTLDGSRILVPSGYGDWDWKDPKTHHWPEWIQPDTPVGANDMVPKSYGWQDPSWYFRMVRDDRSWMFKIESGSASPPMPESLRRFLDSPEAEPGSELYPLNRDWANHGANSYYQPFHEALVRRHGKPATLDEFCWTASLQSIDQHRAMYEAANHRLWDLTSGFMEWKLNACWPTIQWQIYDYFLRPTASYYAIKRAAAPVSVLLCTLDQAVSVINNTQKALAGFRLGVRVLDLTSVVRWQKEVPMDVGPDCAREVLSLPALPDLTPVYFVRLDLLDSDGRLVADNFYWLANRPVGADDTGSLTPLRSLPEARITGTLKNVPGQSGARFTVELHNPGKTLALLTRARVLAKAGGEEILPAYWSDNYVSLLPNETRQLTLELPEVPDQAAFSLAIDGWNVKAGATADNA
jgi:exo-1,4-beta-D-glucosaminidase